MATYISSGTYYVSRGTSLNEPVVTNTGRLEVLSGGTTTKAKVSSGGTAIVAGLDESGTYGSGGRLYINRGGACASMTATGAVIYVSGGRIILGCAISGGSMSAAGSGSNTATLNGITMYDSAWVYVSDGAVASNTVISSGVLRVYSGGLARSTTVHNGTSTIKRICLVLCRKSIMPSQHPTPPPKRATQSNTHSGIRLLPLRFDLALSIA